MQLLQQEIDPDFISEAAAPEKDLTKQLAEIDIEDDNGNTLCDDCLVYMYIQYLYFFIKILRCYFIN